MQFRLYIFIRAFILLEISVLALIFNLKIQLGSAADVLSGNNYSSVCKGIPCNSLSDDGGVEEASRLMYVDGLTFDRQGLYKGGPVYNITSDMGVLFDKCGEAANNANNCMNLFVFCYSCKGDYNPLVEYGQYLQETLCACIKAETDSMNTAAKDFRCKAAPGQTEDQKQYLCIN